jgi:branched-chain amino acid transport system ATP-binding protein
VSAPGLAEIHRDELSELALHVHDVSVVFGGVRALDAVSLAVRRSQVTGLIGPNGAGKTTLFNVITGLQTPDAGRIVLRGHDVTTQAPVRRARQGMARTFQRLEVFGSLTAYENLLAAAEFRRGRARDRSDPRAVAEGLLDKVGLRAVAHERVDGLPTGLARLVELGRALATRPALLLLDEPGSGLDGAESDALGELLVETSKEGTAVLIVEHDVELVMRICSTVHVLDFGRLIASGSPSQVQRDPAVQLAYLGAEENSVVRGKGVK